MHKLPRLRLNRRVLILSGLILLTELVIFSYLSYPPNLLYLLRKGAYSVIVDTKPTPQEKAQAYLTEAVRLQKHFTSAQGKNPQDPNLGYISQELTFQEQNAISQMDLAKKNGVNIKDQVTILCDTLLKQYGTLQKSIAQAHSDAKPGLQQSMEVIEKHIAESIGW